MSEIICVQNRQHGSTSATREEAYALWWRIGYSSFEGLDADHFSEHGLSSSSTLILSKDRKPSGGLGRTFIYPEYLLKSLLVDGFVNWELASSVYEIEAESLDQLLNQEVANAQGWQDEYLAACCAFGLRKSDLRYRHVRLRGCELPLPGPGRIPIRYPVPGTGGQELAESFFSPKALVADGMARHGAGVLILPEIFGILRPLFNHDADLYIETVNVPQFR